MARGKLVSGGKRIRDVQTGRVHPVKRPRKGEVRIARAGDGKIYDFTLVPQLGGDRLVARLKGAHKKVYTT